MPRRTLIIFFAFMASLGVVALVLTLALPRWLRGSRTQTAITAPASPAAPGRRIKARLFYVADDGLRLKSVERDVAYGEGAVEQARQIVEAQMAPTIEPLVSAVPPATKLRAIFITERGEAFVDVSREIATGHSGGSTDELLTVYALVSALTVNLPAVKSVQLLVDGKQVDTLAGHVNLRRPLERNAAWIQ